MRRLFRFCLAALATLALAEIADLAWLSYSKATITGTATKVVGGGNGSNTIWNFSFVGVSAADLIVTYTDATGNSTVLTLNSQYSVTFNTVPPNSVWSTGGFVTYPLTGLPIALGTTLTIARKVPYTQTTSFQNQGQFLPQSVEIAVDLLTMQVQQLNTLFSGALVQPATDASPLAPLPAAAQRANAALCFDSTGYNPIACVTPSSGTISSAMQPVVNSASLAAGRTAFGLGGMAVENIGGGTCGGASIQDDGGGYARVVPATVQDSIGVSVTCAMHYTYRIASGPITYTLARASTTYFNGFTITINSFVAATTVLPNASDNFAGVASGTSITIPQGSTCRITTDAASSATWRLDCLSSQAALAAVASASALTLTLYAASLPFRDTTLANGDSLWALPAGGLSVTIPSGATLGTSSSNVPFRIWIFAAYNSGTPVLVVATCSSNVGGGTIYPCRSWELIRRSAAAITAGSTALGTPYASAGVTNDSMRIIGYADYAGGLTTAGTWASAPTTLQVCLPPLACPKPGEMIQMTAANGATTTSVGTSYTQTVATAAIAPFSTANLVRIDALTNVTTGALAAAIQLSRGAGPTLIGSQPLFTGTAGGASASLSVSYIDAPAMSSLTSYYIYGKSSSSTVTIGNTWQVILQEIMGALSEPANDNGSAALRMVG